MKEPYPPMERGPQPSPHGSTNSLQGNGAVTRNAGFQKESSSTEHLPWNSSPSISLPRNCHLNLSSMTENSGPTMRTISNASTLASLSADLSPSDSHFFEVLYIGKVKVSQRKVPDSLIDDALYKFAQHEADKSRQADMRRNSLLSSQPTSISSNSASVENLTEKDIKTELASSQTLGQKNGNTSITGTSTTPLEPCKNHVWKSSENLTPNSLKCASEGLGSEIDQEFDNFTKERACSTIAKQHIKKPSNIALEPNVLILNVPPAKNNLTTLTEDENEGVSTKSDDMVSVISDSASSVTQFCQEGYRKDASPKEKSPKDITKLTTVNTNLTSVSSIDHKQDVTLTDVKDKTATAETKDNTISSRNSCPEEQLNFEEVGRKPKVLMRSKTGLEGKSAAMPENKPFLRDRSASIGTLNLSKTPITHLIGEQNRTMLFQVGRTELRLISPDRKQILLHRPFRDVASCVLGRGHRDHFGFICRELTSETYVCYVFKCESDSVATEVVNAIKQAFTAHAEMVKKSRERSPNMTCDHCPMLWYHRLCHDVDGMNEKRTHAFILRRVEQLPLDEQEQIIIKYQGGTNHMYEVSDHNGFLMMLLRAHSEAKQLRHVHDTAENRSEFLNQYLGGSTIFMKAKRSLSSGFDHLLKRKNSKDDFSASLPPAQAKKEPSPLPCVETASEPSTAGQHLTADLQAGRSKSLSPAAAASPNGAAEPPQFPNPSNGPGGLVGTTAEEEMATPNGPVTSSPMMDIFLKVGDTKSALPEGGNSSEEESSATWRQAIFQRVVAPATEGTTGEAELTPKNLLNLQEAGREPNMGRRSREELRELWRMAINQTVLLVRMEKENARLRESEESAAERRIKLEYTDMGAIDGGFTLVWDSLLSGRDTSPHVSKVDHHMLTQAVRQGVPRVCRGGVWYFLAEQACLRSSPPDSKKFPNYHSSYHSLLSGLTKHQHAILIDLGRTFPQHSYFASSFGPGQLGLYNLLKAYSLLDPDVGYCQGLSFVAGVLLLHMEEAEAFVLLRHLMFRRGLRKQYLPDMSALQVQLYQLSRLLRDHEPELHAKLEALDIAPALYAAPWMLTLFTSQFPLGFVVRVFDLIFLESLDIVFAVSLALLSVHKDGLMLCESCEEAAEYLKHKLPDVDKTIYDKVMKKVFSLDISRQLAEYAVEYGVLREEMPRIAQLAEQRELNKKLTKENVKIMGELDSAMESISNYQSTQSRLESQVRLLEQQLGYLTRYTLAHHDKKQELPVDIKRICNSYNKKVGFGTKITTFSSKFTSNELAEEDETDPKNGRSIRKTGISTPNLFLKLTKDEVLHAGNKMADKSNASPDIDNKKPISVLKKSQSVSSGLIAPLKPYPMKVLDVKKEPISSEKQQKPDDLMTDFLRDVGKKNSGFFANSHEQIRQERLFAQQLKHDFDENLKRLDAKMPPSRSYIDDLAIFQGQKSMSLNFDTKKVAAENAKNAQKDRCLNDSGFVTPLSPLDKSVVDYNRKDDTCSITSHPLSDCDVDIKFDGQLTKLKCLGPVIKPNNLESRTPSIESGESKYAM